MDDNVEIHQSAKLVRKGQIWMTDCHFWCNKDTISHSIKPIKCIRINVHVILLYNQSKDNEVYKV